MRFPADFPVREVHESLDYDLAKIADADYMLPLKAVVTSKAQPLRDQERHRVSSLSQVRNRKQHQVRHARGIARRSNQRESGGREEAVIAHQQLGQ